MSPVQLCEDADVWADSLGHPLDRGNLNIMIMMLASAAAGIAHLHSCRVVHRDLAARNILVSNREPAGEELSD